MNTLTNIGISIPLVTLNIIIWGIYAGLVIACIMAVRARNIRSDVVSSLLDGGAVSEADALTLGDAGLKPRKIKAALRALRSGTVLSRYVHCANKDAFVTALTGKAAKAAKFFSLSREKEKLTPDARFFIPEDARVTAEVRFKTKKANIWAVVIFAAALAVVMAFISEAIPKLISMLDETVGYLGSL